MLFNPAAERMPLPRLRALQNERLRAQVACVHARVPFYRPRRAARPRASAG